MKPLPPCIFPSLSEQDVVTVPGTEPCTAYRLRVEPGVDGYLRIEQLAYNAAMGWYTQKSFCMPGDVVHQLMPHLKMASALLPVSDKDHLASNGEPLQMSDASQWQSAGNTAHVNDENLPLAPLRFPGPDALPATDPEIKRKSS